MDKRPVSAQVLDEFVPEGSELWLYNEVGPGQIENTPPPSPHNECAQDCFDVPAPCTYAMQYHVLPSLFLLAIVLHCMDL